MNAPETYIQFTPGLIDEQDDVTIESTGGVLCNFMSECHDHVARALSVLPNDA